MATSREVLQIIIEALNLSEDEMRQLRSDLGDVDKQSQRGASSMDKMKNVLRTLTVAAGTATAAFFALKKGFDFAEEGAQLKLTEERFSRLAGSIGTSADALQTDLRIATQGLVSDTEQMHLATELMSLGLAKSHEEAIRLAAVAGQLGMNMNQLVLTLTNQTTMRFDALGVSVDGFEAKVEKLENAGLDANEAFKMAFIEQAEDQVRKVGSVAGTSAGEFARLSANVKNAKDDLKVLVSEGITPALTMFNKWLESSDRYQEIAKDSIKSTMSQETAYSKYVDTIVGAAKETKDMSEADAERLRQALMTNEGIEDMSFLQKILIKDTQAMTQEAFVQARRLNDLTNQYSQIDQKLGILPETIGAVKISATETVEPLSGLPEALQLTVDSLQDDWMPAWAEARTGPQDTLRTLELMQARAESIARGDFLPDEQPEVLSGRGDELMLGGKLLGGGRGGQFGPGFALGEIASGTIEHLIKFGETLTGIAADYDTTISKLLELNEFIQDPNLIFAGDRLKVPFEETLETIAGGDGIQSNLEQMTQRTYPINIEFRFSGSGNVPGGLFSGEAPIDADIPSTVGDAMTEHFMQRFGGLE